MRTSSEKAAIALAVGSGVLGLAAAVVYALGRRRSSEMAGTGAGAASKQRARLVEKRKAGGMTMSVYTDAVMPLDMRVGHIQDLTRESIADPQIQALAQAIVGVGRKRVQVGKYYFDVQGAGCGNNAACRADAIGRWTAANVRYTGDLAPVKQGRNGVTEGIDLFQSTKRTLEVGGGDCDDQTVVNCSLSEVVGVPCKHRVTAPTPQSEWAHIFSVDEADGRELVLDTTLPGEYRTGREARYGKKREYRSH